ncbi:MAG: DivIVA domain-containing protein [bacterium]
MRLSPLDISKQEFARALRGYHPAEVRAFLEKVADEFAELESGRATLLQQKLKLEAQLETYKQMEQTLRESLLMTQKSLEEARANADHERELILREAGLEAEQIKREADRHVTDARMELERLAAQRDTYLKRLRYLLHSQQELIDMLENETPLREDTP